MNKRTIALIKMGTPSFEQKIGNPVTYLSCGKCNIAKVITECIEREEEFDAVLPTDISYKLSYSCPDCGSEVLGAVIKKRDLV